MDSNNSIYKICSTIKEGYTDEALNKAFHLLIKMFNNIIKNPNEPKFRQFKITNEAIRSKILIIKETLDLVKEAGFTEFDEEHLAYKEIKTDRLKKAVDIMTTYNAEAEEKIRAREILKKNEELNRLNEEINAKFREEQKKKQEIMKQLEYDKMERAKKEKATDSIGNDLKFGANLKKFECKQPRG